jgi:hypothetical protein
MPNDDTPPGDPPEVRSSQGSAQGISEAQEQRSLKALIGSGAAEFPMDVQMANMEPAGGEPPPPPTVPATTPQAAPATPTSEGNT